MNEKLAKLMERSVNTTDRKKIKGLWRRILASFSRNQDQIIEFFETGTDIYDQERIIKNIRAMPDKPFWPIVIMHLKRADDIESNYLFDNAVAQSFRKIHDRRIKFKLLKKLSVLCEEDYEQMMVLRLLGTMRLPAAARILMEHLNGPDHLDFQQLDSPEILKAYIIAIEKLTLD